MYQITLHSDDNSKSLSQEFDKAIYLDAKPPKGYVFSPSQSENSLCSIDISEEKVTFVPLDQNATFTAEGNELSAGATLSLPLSLQINDDLTLSVQKQAGEEEFSNEDISSLIQELESSNHEDVEEIRTEIHKASTQEKESSASVPPSEVDEVTSEDLATIEKLFSSPEGTDNDGSEDEVNFADLIEEASSTEVKEEPRKEPLSTEKVDEEPISQNIQDDLPPIEFAEDEPDPDTPPLLVEDEVVEDSKVESESFEEEVSSDNEESIFFEPIQPKRAKLPYWAVALLVLVLVSFVFIYVRQSETGKVELTKQALADFSMCVFYAHVDGENVNTFFPPNNNTITPLSIEIVDPMLTPLQGAFEKDAFLNGFNYEFLYKVSSDEEKFLLAAKPKKGLLNWFFSKPYLVLSSDDMIMREAPSQKEGELFIESMQHDSYNKCASQLSQLPFTTFSGDPNTIAKGFYVPKALLKTFPNSGPYLYLFPRYYKGSSLAFDYLSRLTAETTHIELTVKASSYLSALAAHPLFTFYSTKDQVLLIGLRNDLKRYGTFFQSLIFGHVEQDPITGNIMQTSILEPSLLKHKQYISEKSHSPGPITTSALDTLKNKIEGIANTYHDSASLSISNLENLLEDQEILPTEEEEAELLAYTRTYQQDRHTAAEHAKARIDALFQEWVTEKKRVSEKEFFQLIKNSKCSFLLSEKLRDLAKNINFQLKEAPEFEKAIITLTKFESSTTLDESIQSAIKLNQLLTKENFSSALEHAVYKRRFQLEVLAKVRTLFTQAIFQKDLHEQPPAIERVINMQKINSLFDVAGISPSLQAKFFDQVFDNLNDALSYLPSSYTASQLQKLRDSITLPESSRKKSSGEEKIARSIARIPLTVDIDDTPDAEAIDIARLGKQLLIKNKYLPPSPERSEALRDAISLLERGTFYHRSYWGNILEARNLILSSPQEELHKELLENLLFTENLTTNIRNSLSDYQAELNRIISTQDDFGAEPASLYTDILTKKLTFAKKSIQTLLQEEALFYKNLKEYIQAMREFLSDFEKAREEGYFSIGRVYESQQLQTLRQKLHGAIEIKADLDARRKAFYETVRKYLQFIDNQERLLTSKMLDYTEIDLKRPIPLDTFRLSKKLKENLAIYINPNL